MLIALLVCLRWCGFRTHQLGDACGKADFVKNSLSCQGLVASLELVRARRHYTARLRFRLFFLAAPRTVRVVQRVDRILRIFGPTYASGV